MARKGKNQAKAQGKKKSKNGAQRRSSAKSRGGNVSVVIRGNGDYEVGPVEDLGSYQKALALRRVGQMAGEKVGMPRLGRMAGAGFSKFVGHGDYQVKTNSLIKGALSSGPEMVPYFSRTGKSGIRVREREFLGFVVTGANGVYTSTSYHINPGLQGAFPWLSQVAQNFEEWEPYGLVYEFVSTSAQFAGGSNQALGTVAMATDYDVLDSTFINMTELLNMGAACSTRSSNDLEHGVECDITERGRRSFFVRTGAPPTQSTLMDYDLGLFEIATQGSPAATGVQVGQLWASYDIGLFKKNLYAGQLGNNILSWAGNPTAATVSLSHPWGTSWVNQTGSFEPSVSGTTLTLPAWIVMGTFLLQYYAYGGSTTVTEGTWSFTNAALVTKGPTGIATDVVGPYSGDTGKALLSNIMFNVTGSGAAITLTSVGLPSGTSQAQFFITQVYNANTGSSWPALTSDPNE